MIIRIASIVFLFTLVCGEKVYCNYENAIAYFKRPTYEFSMRILDRVAQDTRYHFVFSPLSTWLQLMSVAEGAKGSTLNEIWKVTRYHPAKCFRRKFREILNSMDEELSYITKMLNVIVINKLLDVKKSFENEIEVSNTSKVLSVNFNDPHRAAMRVNEELDVDKEELDNGFYADDFNLTVLLMSDTGYFKSDWLRPFNPVYTSTEHFYSETNVPIGDVRLMAQQGWFNLTHVSLINADVLELPFNTNGRVSMLVFLPTSGTVNDVFYNMFKIRLMTIFNLYKTEGTKLVTVKLPRFKTTTEMRNLPELVYDMGVERMFYPETAELGGISNYQTFASVMNQIVDIEITEKGATGNIIPDNIAMPGQITDFVANKPFAYLIVDRKTEVILFGGMYIHPSIY